MSDLLTMTTLCGFPKSFLSSLKVLFDILDDRGTGYVKLADIEERWRDDGSVDSLPPGVTAALRKVAPPDGKLTFERFVAGLKIALLHDRSDSSETEPNLNDVNNKLGRKEPIPPTYRAKPVSAVNLGGHKSGTSNDVPLMTKQRAFSMPQLDGKVPYPHNAHGGNAGTKRGESTDQQYFHSANQRQQATNRPPGNNNRNGADPDMLYRWQQQQLLKAGDQEKRSSDRQSDFRKPGDGKSSTSSSSALEQYSGVAGDVAQAKGRGSTAAPPGGTRMVKRRDSRRHTLANGVDFNMIKRMKQLERERDILLQGLEMVERARNWYQQQLHAVQEKQRSASAHNDQSLEAHQERISLQMARIFEVNQQLKALVESSEKGLPFHMNLAVSGPGRPHMDSVNHTTELREKDTTIGRLKSQNKMLTQEVSATSEKVTQLEQEKRQLIRELFEARAHKHKSENKTRSYDDTTFI